MASATIKLFLIHGEAKRLRVAEILNWTGKAIAGPRSELEGVLAREEAAKSGVYFLIGTDSESGKPAVYIGEAESIRDRLRSHLDKDFWNHVIFFVNGERFTFSRLNIAARMAERRGARIMGLGAFTSVVGDGGITVANESDIAITSGNSLTVAATLEAAKQAVIQMGAKDMTKGKVWSSGRRERSGRCARACSPQAIYDVVLVSIEPAKLIELKRKIQQETPGSTVIIATRAADLLGECDLIVPVTSAFGQRVIDITKCKPGAVICDVARPPDINEAEAALRPDVLVIESGEVLIPGDIDFGYDFGLPTKTSYACLAETALLAMEGRFEDCHQR